jgi:hypothetical protein
MTSAKVLTGCGAAVGLEEADVVWIDAMTVEGAFVPGEGEDGGSVREVGDGVRGVDEGVGDVDEGVEDVDAGVEDADDDAGDVDGVADDVTGDGVGDGAGNVRDAEPDIGSTAATWRGDSRSAMNPHIAAAPSSPLPKVAIANL